MSHPYPYADDDEDFEANLKRIRAAKGKAAYGESRKKPEGEIFLLQFQSILKEGFSVG